MYSYHELRLVTSGCLNGALMWAKAHARRELNLATGKTQNPRIPGAIPFMFCTVWRIKNPEPGESPLRKVFGKSGRGD